jgi:hypothetical protein
MRIKILQSKPQPQIAVEVESAEDTTAIPAALFGLVPARSG